MNSFMHIFRVTIFLFVLPVVLSSATTDDFWCPAGSLLGYGNSQIETDSRGHIFCLGTGLHRSSDSGKSWQTSPAPRKYSDDVLESAGDGVLIIGSDEVYRSVDGGENWTVISPLSGHSGYVFLSAVSTGTIAVAIEDTVYISYDRGDTWQHSVVAVDSAEEHSWLRMRVLVSPNGDVYAANYTRSEELYVMRKDSAEWVQLPTQDIGVLTPFAVGDRGEIYAVIDSGRIGRFDPVTQSWSISVDKLDNAEGCKILPDGRVYFWTYQFLYTTDDEGITWQRADSGLPKDRSTVIRDLAMGKGREVYISTYNDGVFMLSPEEQVWQPIVSDMVVVPANKLITSQKGDRLFVLSYYSGIYRSDNGGATWQRTSLLRTTDGSKLPYLSIGDITRATNGTLYVCAGSDGIFMSNDDGDSWSRIAHIPHTGFATLGVAADGSLVAARTQYGWDADMAKSTDGGASWTTVLKGYELLAPIVQGRGTTLFANSRSGLLISPDNGETWRKVEIPGAKQDFQLFDIVYTEDGQLFLGTNWGIWLSPDNGANWSTFGSGRGLYFKILYTKRGHLYAAGTTDGENASVIKTEDGGVTWEDLSAGLTDQARALAEDADGRLYAGGSFMGVAKNCVVTDVGKYAPGPSVVPSISCFPNPASGWMNISYQLPSPGYVAVKLVDLAGREVAVLVNEWKPTGVNTHEWAYDLPRGIYMLVLTSGAEQVVCPVYCR